MSDHAPPMNDQIRIWMSTCSAYCLYPPMGSAGASASSASTATPRARATVTASPAPGEDAARTREDHDDEHDEGDDIAHLGRPHHARHGDDLAHHEGGHEGP